MRYHCSVSKVKLILIKHSSAVLRERSEYSLFLYLNYAGQLKAAILGPVLLDHRLLPHSGLLTFTKYRDGPKKKLIILLLFMSVIKDEILLDEIVFTCITERLGLACVLLNKIFFFFLAGINAVLIN